MADVTVTIGAQDDGSLNAAISTTKAKLDELKRGPGMAQAEWGQIGKIFGGLPGPPGGFPPTGGGAGFQAMAQGATQAAAAINNVAQAQNNVAQASSRAGSMVERMFERMILRAGLTAIIFGTIHEILKGLGEAISFEKAETQFQYLIGSGQKFEQQLKGINREFEVTHTAKDKLMDVEKALYRLGDPVQNLTADMQMLDQYAKVTGEDVSKLAHGLTDLRLGRASIDEMYQMTALMGEQGQGLHDQIASYQRIEAELPRIQRQQELNLRLQEHQWMLADRQRDATNRLKDAQSDFAGQLGITKTLFEAMQQGASGMQYAHAAGVVGGVDVERAAEAEGKRLDMGEQQIQQEEHLSNAEVKSLERQGLINAKMLEGAADRRRAEQERAQQQRREDERFAIQIGMEILRYNLEQQNLALQGQVLAGLQSFVGLSKGLTENLQTAASAFEKLGADIANIAKEMPGLATALAHLAEELDKILKGLGQVPGKAKEGMDQASKEMDKILPGGGAQSKIDKLWSEMTPEQREEVEHPLPIHTKRADVMDMLKRAFTTLPTPSEKLAPEGEKGIATEKTLTDIKTFLQIVLSIPVGL